MASSIRKEFDVAFRSALDAGESTFEFQGKKYNTKMAPPKTTSNRGGARMKSGTDIMDTLPKVGKVDRSEFEDYDITPEQTKGLEQTKGFKAEDMGMNQYRKPKLSDFVPDFLTNKAAQNRETTLRKSLESMAKSPLTPKAGDRPLDEPAYRKGGKVDFSKIIRNKKTGVLSMKKAEGGMVKAKRTSHRGAGIAVKGFGRAGGR